LKSNDRKLRVKYKNAAMVELRVYGLAASLEPNRPVLIFRSECENHTVGVPLSPLEAGITISQNIQRGSGSSPHGLSLKVLQKMGVRPLRCFFKEVRGHFLYMDIEFETVDKKIRVESRADEAVSFCLRGGARFYSSIDLIQDCKDLEKFHLGADKDHKIMDVFDRSKNKHPYLM
jgi:hypothetical protein